jgi:hypothetical protein
LKLLRSDGVSSIMDDFNEKDALWNLLGRSRRIEASPYFVRKVMRAVVEEKRPAFSWVALLRWFIPAATCAAIVIAWTAYRYDQQETFNAYFDNAADLESLIAFEDASPWLEESAL